MVSERRTLFAFLAIGAMLGGCATVPVREGRSPADAKESICETGQRIQRVTGSIWAWFEEGDRTAQFPAFVRAERGGKFAIEIVDLLGDTQTRIEKVGWRYRISGPRAGEVDRGFRELFELVHAPVLEAVLLGGFPCPKGDPRWEGENILVFPDRSRAELTMREGRPWLEKWVSGTGGSIIEWRFSGRAEEGSPLEWEAFWKVAGRAGSLRIRWRDRKVEQSDI